MKIRKTNVLKYVSFCLALLLVFVATACQGIRSPVPASSNSTETLTPVKLGVGFVPNVQFAVFYVGIEKGFYSAEGIDLEMNYGFENDYLKLVGVNEMQFMIGSSDQVVIGRAQGLPVQYIMNWYTQYPVVVFAKKEANITKPADLAGKTIGVPGPFGASYVALRGLLEVASLSEEEIKLESIGFTQAAAVREDRVDAAVDYSVNGPIVLALAGVETTQIKLDAYLRIPANGLVTNETTIEQQPELAGKMVHATQKAIEYTLANPDEAFAIALKFVPEAGGDNEKANRAVFDASLEYWTPPAGQKIGVIDPTTWPTAVDLLKRIGLIDTAPSVETLYNQQFVQTSLN